MSYIKMKRGKVDTCNICLKTSELTWDHVPPKSGIALSSMEIENIHKLLTGKNEPRRIFSQNGVKYRTICRDCNSKLGSEYDKILNSLNSDVAIYLRSQLNLPYFTYLKTRPIRLIKSILGHVLAAKQNIDKSSFDQKVRDYLFDDTAALADDIHIFYWIFPFDCIIIQRDFAMPAVRGKLSDSIFCHVLKYFPLAFLIGDKEQYQNLPSLTKFRACNIDDEIDLRVDLIRIEFLDWPEKVDGGNIIGATEESMKGILAKPRYLPKDG